MRLHQVPPIDCRGDTAYHLHRRELRCLAEARRTQVDEHHVVLIIIDGADLAGEVDAGLLAEPEGLEVMAELVDAQLAADLDEGRVAGIRQCLGEGLHAVAGEQVAVDGLAGDLVGTAAIEAVVLPVDGLLLDGGRGGEDLEDRAGGVDLGDGLVLPLLLAGVEVGLLVLLLGEGGEGVRGALVIDGRGVVEVEGRVGRHRVDRAGVHVHDDAAGAVAHLELGTHLLEVLLHGILQRGVDREVEGGAVLGVIGRGIAVGHRPAVGVLRGGHAAVDTGEVVVVIRLEAVLAVVVAVREADHLRGQLVLRVVALGVLLGRDGLDAQLLKIRHQLVGHVLLDLALEDVILRILLHRREDDVLRDAELGGEQVDDLVLDLLTRLDDGLGREGLTGVQDGLALVHDLLDLIHLLAVVHRVDVYLIYGRAPCEGRAGAVVDGAAARGDRAVGEMGVVRHLGIFLVVTDGQHPDPDDDRTDHQHQRCHHPEHQPLVHPGRRLMVCISHAINSYRPSRACVAHWRHLRQKRQVDARLPVLLSFPCSSRMRPCPSRRCLFYLSRTDSGAPLHTRASPYFYAIGWERCGGGLCLFVTACAPSRGGSLGCCRTIP